VHKFAVKKNNVKEKMMQKRTRLMAVVFALVVLLVGTSSVFAQVQFMHFQLADVQPESCVICHSEAGDDHQAIYDDYADASSLELTVDSVTSVDNGDGTYTATMKFSIEKDGVAYIDVDGLPTLEQKRFYGITYDSATGKFYESIRFRNEVALGGGQYSVAAEGISYKPETSNGAVYAYIADGLLDTESGGHVHMYNDVASAAKAFGDVATYESAANVSGCEKCHGAPYMKHGYRDPVVEGLSDFASCKTCHYDDRNGGHEDWQILVDNPARYAEVHAGADLTPEEEAQYAYTANIMNDVHMSHSMEFPYPQSMSTCATCHEGKLDSILTDANFKLETCKSCHPVDGPEEGTGANRAPALATLPPHELEIGKCSNCHSSGSIAPPFSEIHTGYDKVIYAAADLKYSDAIVVSIDDASVADNKITIRFSAVEDPNLAGIDVADIAPTVLVGMYGWDTKDFIIGPHERLTDDNDDGEISRSSGDQRALEYEVGAEHPRATTVSAADGNWEVVVDMSTWADLIADGTVKRVEIAITPELENADGVQVALNAPSRTFDLNANDFDDDFYSDIVKVVDGCNTCHDALATTFHSPDRGGNIVTCRMCHITKSRGSHLEMQSRSIDSYIHAIHSFQAFDIGDVNFVEPVEAVHYDLHVEHVYPNFTIKNCESCHNEGTYNVPDQSKSLPGAISASDSPLEGWDRNIGDVPLYITGPGSRACGSCHRAELINEDEVSELISFNQHTKQGGYLIEGGDDYTGILGEVIDYIMALFK
jgi:OmcA/MtrC family decaheme c-type cytochrome